MNSLFLYIFSVPIPIDIHAILRLIDVQFSYKKKQSLALTEIHLMNYSICVMKCSYLLAIEKVKAPREQATNTVNQADTDQ